MMAAPTGFGQLDAQALQRIEDLSLQVLEQVGVAVDDDLTRASLAAHGARVEPTGRVHFDEQTLRALIGQAPADVTFGQRQGDDRTVGAHAGGTCLWPGNALYLVEDTERHVLRLDDFARLTRLTDRLDHVHAMVGISVADFEPNLRDFCTLRLMAQHTGKHLRPVITSTHGIGAVMEMAQVLRGSDKADAPVGFGFSVLSPLRWTQTATQLIRDTSGQRWPFMFNAEPLAGGTSPVTLAGSLAQAHAETLSGIAIAQALEPGRPCIYNAGFAHTLDMRSAVALGGSPEVFLMAAAAAGLARMWQLPCASWVGSEAMTEDAQAATEKSLGLTLHTQAGVNLIWGMGQLESQMSISATQMVIDDEIAVQVERLQRGITVDDAHLAADILLSDPGTHGNLLAHDHTLTWFRHELDDSTLANRILRERWQELGKPDMRRRANEHIGDLLADEWVPCVSDDEDAELLRIEEAWRRQLSG